MDRWTRLGIEAYQSGNRAQAQRFFRYALMEKPDDIRTWLWLAEVVETDHEKVRCLEQVLKIDPQHALAITALDIYKTRANRSNLPHVAPFGGDEEPAEGELAAASVEVRSTPPFMAALAGDLPVQAPKSKPFWRLRETWLTAGMLVLGLVVVGLITFLILQGIPR
jgi:hypothetical protein